MGVQFWVRMEEPCELDGVLRIVLAVADDVLRLPVIIGRLHTQPSGGTDSLYSCDISHARLASLWEKLVQKADALRVLEEELRFSRLTPRATSISGVSDPRNMTDVL